MKILTIAGTRPELIRLSLIIKKLDLLVDHVLVYTNQNYDFNLSGVFFQDLGIRKPDYYFDERSSSFSKFFAGAIIKFEEIILKEKPDKILVLGDTNSGLLTLIAERYKVTIYHMEAGNRCYDKRVPEETNRRLIDHLSTYNLPYTEISKNNLVLEGFDKNKVFKTGNPIYEVLDHYKDRIDSSNIIEDLGITDKDFVLVTSHRSENVDHRESLSDILSAVNEISRVYKVIFPVHPRTLDKIHNFGLFLYDNVKVTEPLGFFDFVKLEKNAKAVITDSGTVQEECCILGVPSLIIRRSTERMETIECGASVLSGTRYKDIINAFDMIKKRKSFTWIPPGDYMVDNVSDTIINLLIGI